MDRDEKITLAVSATILGAYGIHVYRTIKKMDREAAIRKIARDRRTDALVDQEFLNIMNFNKIM